MLKFTPILLALLYGLAMYRFSAWRTARELDDKSTELADPHLKALTDRMAASLDLPRIRVHIYEIDPVRRYKQAILYAKLQAIYASLIGKISVYRTSMACGMRFLLSGEVK